LTPPPPPTSTLFPYTTLFRSYWIGEPATSNKSAGPIQHKEDRSSSVVHERVVLDRATLIRLLRPVNDEDANVGCAFIYSTQWLRSEEHTSELQSRGHLVCRLL